MLTREGARLQVFLELRRWNGLRRGPEELVIVDNRVIERPWGWVFPYTTRGCLNGDPRYEIAGNGPIMINRHDGSMRPCGTALPAEHYIEEYEAELERRSGAWALSIDEPATAPLATLKALRSALQLSVTELGTLRDRLPCVLKVGARVDLEPLYCQLVAAGIHAHLGHSTADDA